MSEELSVELAVEGISKEAFARAMNGLREFAEPALPIITGEWGLEQTLLYAAALAALAMTVRLILHLADGGKVSQLPRAAFSHPNDRALDTKSGRSAAGFVAQGRPEAFSEGSTLAGEQAAPTASPDTVSIIWPEVFKLLHAGVMNLTKLYLHYVVISVLVCWIFGVGDLDASFAVFGIGSQ